MARPRSLVVTFALTLAAVSAAAAVPWPGEGWEIDAQESRVESYLGRDALLIRNGAAWLDTAGFRDGSIEFDLAVPDVQGFHGVAFRAADRENYEEIYLRPHQRRNPDATQLQPVYHGVTSWQIYGSNRFNQPIDMTPERWMHVKVVVSGQQLALSVDGETLVYPALQRPPAAGGIGLLSGGQGPARFANVVIRNEAPPPIAIAPDASPAPLPPGLVRRWRVSSPFAEERIRSDRPLSAEHRAGLSWAPLVVTETGAANLAMLHGRTDEKNTVFAAVTLRAREAGPVTMRFGFSDRVVVFLNGAPVYRGNDGYRSRDYRFLGTVGLWDELVLPLRRGDNEVWLAVSETFGGWAAMAEIVPREGVVVVAGSD